MLEQEPRKASDVLLALESKIESLLGIIRNQDLKIGIISNKLNTVMELLKNSPKEFKSIADDVTFPSYSASTEYEKNVNVLAETTLPQENNPKGFRRTSRPETYAGDNAQLPKQPKNTQTVKQSVKAEVIVPTEFTSKPVAVQVPPKPKLEEQANKNTIPIMQRVVDRNGKSVFLADVEIIDLTTNQPVFKTRTNGTGKWMASLVPNNYRVLIKKIEPLTKERVETPQEILVDGTKSPLELPMLIIK
jgi:hypothetical protein